MYHCGGCWGWFCAMHRCGHCQQCNRRLCKSCYMFHQCDRMRQMDSPPRDTRPDYMKE
jgi:hypothetical protein